MRWGATIGLLTIYNTFGRIIRGLSNIWRLTNSTTFKGHLDVSGMQKFLDITVEKGGSVHAGTVLQIIAIPQSRTIYIRGYEYSNWQKVELGPLFAVQSKSVLPTIDK